MKVAIVGATGYGGAELIRLLNHHPEVEIVSLHSSSQQGLPYVESYPHLQDIIHYSLEDIDPLQMAEKAELVFLATPSGISANLTPKLHQAGLKVIDLSGDLRINDLQVYEKWYRKQPSTEETVKSAVYGLSEWFKDDIQSATIVANPGCYPTATLIGLAPLIQQKLVVEDSIIVDAKSAVSGAGRSPSAATHFTEINDNFKIYKVNQHQHIPEIEQILNVWNPEIQPISFNTHLVPMTRGIMSTIYVKPKDVTTIDQLIDLYNGTYVNHPFVRIRKKGSFPATKEVYGSNYCDIGIAYDERTGRIMVVSVIDNLVKGAAGQAVQNLNIMMGLDETTGLQFVPVYP
ncbi:N-acetyl-gamma-glutamyl-phosphate reductase [Calidifontibacillus oryziterrae]|uniref:N-acetyl-gamma-glutamyl-phosphate reductase n=1 Tax=Calidifontibacillus oryziterrae TaxID=1191699 RepID=UPI0003102145|nr:N-acetyl-gamma-glutamyl-phosphate reductase [Calidifontibacillus oryziterrae]